MVEGEISMKDRVPASFYRTAGASSRRRIKRLLRVKKRLLIMLSAAWLSISAIAQETSIPLSSAASGNTIIGCLAGPDVDDHYTLTSMQHRTGVEVVGSEDLKTGAGAKVKLSGTWEALPNADSKKSDATQRFWATQVTVLEEKCQPPQAVAPVSKKKKSQPK